MGYKTKRHRDSRTQTAVVTRGKRGGEEVDEDERSEYMETEGNSALGRKHTMQQTYGVLLNCTLQTYIIILLNNVTLIHLI